MSSVGEFKKRLQLIFAFLGQTSAGLLRGCYSRFGLLVLVSVQLNKDDVKSSIMQ